MSAQIKGVSESKELSNRGYKASQLSNQVKVRISLVILKELMEGGHVVNRHIKMLFDENEINSFEDLEIKNLAFIQIEKGQMGNMEGLDLSALNSGNVAAAAGNNEKVQDGAPGNRSGDGKNLAAAAGAQ